MASTRIDSRARYYPTLISWSFRRERNRVVLLNVLLVLAGTALLTLSAKLPIAVTPVPFTLQTLVLLVMGMVYGAKVAGLTVFVYLLEGALGLPIFESTPEKGVGLTYMMGPDGGYLVGYLLAAMTTGYLAQRGWDRSVWWTAAAMVIGFAVIYIPGLLWMGHTLGWDQPIEMTGLLSFLWSDLTKLCIAAIAVPLIWRATTWPSRRGHRRTYPRP